MKKLLISLLIFGVITQCFADGHFDGNDAIVVQDPGANSPMDTTDAITIVSWARADPSTLGGQDGGPDNQIIMNKDEYDSGGRTSIGPEIAVGDNHGSVNNSGYFTYYLPGVSEDSTGNLPVAGSGWKTGSTDPIFKDGEWHMVAITYNKTSGRLLTYVDGELQKNVSAQGSIETNDGSIMVSARGDDSHPSCFLKNGSIGDVKMFNRSLTPEEIQELKNNPDALIGNILDMPLINDSTDRSGNGYNSTEYGDPTYNGGRSYITQPAVKSPNPLIAIITAVLIIPIYINRFHKKSLIP